MSMQTSFCQGQLSAALEREQSMSIDLQVGCVTAGGTWMVGKVSENFYERVCVLWHVFFKFSRLNYLSKCSHTFVSNVNDFLFLIPLRSPRNESNNSPKSWRTFPKRSHGSCYLIGFQIRKHQKVGPRESRCVWITSSPCPGPGSTSGWCAEFAGACGSVSWMGAKVMS